jgi:hypothetical protein
MIRRRSQIVPLPTGPGGEHDQRMDTRSSSGAAIALAGASMLALATSVLLAWRTDEFWHSGAGFIIPLLAGALAGAAVWLTWGDWRRHLLALSTGVAVAGIGLVAVLICTLARWEG